MTLTHFIYGRAGIAPRLAMAIKRYRRIIGALRPYISLLRLAPVTADSSRGGKGVGKGDGRQKRENA